jgi:hypothetical protein
MLPTHVKLPIFKTFGEFVLYIRNASTQSNLCYAKRCKQLATNGGMTNMGWVQFCDKHKPFMVEGGEMNNENNI